ncbi:MAG: response regulator [Deltaproteobacteria bacterium]|nr:response regulator [Deltaproteobacteria bacterium]
MREEPSAQEPELVLVVEDDVVTNRMVSAALGRKLNVISAYDGADGLAKAIEESPDLIITDLAMPGMNGDELIRAVRAVHTLDNVPIVILTGTIDDEMRDLVLRNGAQDYLTKPFSTDELRARVGNLLARRRAERRNQALDLELAGARQAGLDERRARSWLESVIEQLPDAVLLTDAQGRVTLRSHAALAMCVDDNAIVLRDACGVPLEPHEEPAARALAERRSVTKRELRVRGADGRLVPVLAGAVPVVGASGDVLGSATVIEDITPIKELERMREEWASIVAHDLRQPVTAILLAADRLARADPPLASSRQADAATRIVSAARRLNVMIGDLLDASCIESGRLCIDRSPCSLRRIIGDVVGDLSDASARCVLALDDAADELLFIDGGRIGQVLANLVGNAVKYGEPRHPITIAMHDTGDSVEVVVANHGRALTEDERGRIFDRFARGAEAPAGRGLGLGLFICRGLVEGHGGRIWAECHDEQTFFHFTLPRAAASATAAPSAAAHAAG